MRRLPGAPPFKPDLDLIRRPTKNERDLDRLFEVLLVLIVMEFLVLATLRICHA